MVHFKLDSWPVKKLLSCRQGPQTTRGPYRQDTEQHWSLQPKLLVSFYFGTVSKTVFTPSLWGHWNCLQLFSKELSERFLKRGKFRLKEAEAFLRSGLQIIQRQTEAFDDKFLSFFQEWHGELQEEKDASRERLLNLKELLVVFWWRKEKKQHNLFVICSLTV